MPRIRESPYMPSLAMPMAGGGFVSVGISSLLARADAGEGWKGGCSYRRRDWREQQSHSEPAGRRPVAVSRRMSP